MTRKYLISLITILLFGLLLAACGGDSGGPVIPDAANGEKLYNRITLGPNSAPGCVTCHVYDESKGDATNAPFTKGTATRAETAVPGLSAEEYIRESIANPDAYVVEGYTAGTMYQKWGEDLTDQEIADIVAYLLTEK